MTFKDVKVYFNGRELVDKDTLDEKCIEDDCILHAVDIGETVVNAYDVPMWVVKSSAELNHWRRLLPCNLKPPARNSSRERAQSKAAFISGVCPSGGQSSCLTWLAQRCRSLTKRCRT